MVHFQRAAVRQAVGAAGLGDEGFADDLVFQLLKQFFVDAALDLLPGKAALALEAEHIVGPAARKGFLPDAHRGPHTDVALPHGKFFLHGQALRPAGHHPFAFDLHGVFLVSVFLYLF
jgi:hypothetical protein